MRAHLFGVNATMRFDQRLNHVTGGRLASHCRRQRTTRSLDHRNPFRVRDRRAAAEAIDQRGARLGAFLKRAGLMAAHGLRQPLPCFEKKCSTRPCIESFTSGSGKCGQRRRIRRRQSLLSSWREVVLRRGLPYRARPNDAAALDEPITLESDQMHPHRVVRDPEVRRQRIHGALASPDQVEYRVTSGG